MFIIRRDARIYKIAFDDNCSPSTDRSNFNSWDSFKTNLTTENTSHHPTALKYVMAHAVILIHNQKPWRCTSHSFIHSFINGSTALCWALASTSVCNLSYTVGRTPWASDQRVARPLPTHRTTQTQNKRIHTFMPWVGSESTIPVFERAKTVHAFDRAATVIGHVVLYCNKMFYEPRIVRL
jgi:hypothetical protein